MVTCNMYDCIPQQRREGCRWNRSHSPHCRLLTRNISAFPLCLLFLSLSKVKVHTLHNPCIRRLDRRIPTRRYPEYCCWEDISTTLQQAAHFR